MSTFSAAIALAVARSNVLVNSGGGAFTANQVIYTAPANRKTIFELSGSVAITVGNGFNINLAIQKRSTFNSAYGSMIAFTANSPGGAVGAYIGMTFDDTAKKILANSGRIIDTLFTETGIASGNQRIILYPDERLIVTGGNCAEGANFRFEYLTEQYFST